MGARLRPTTGTKSGGVRRGPCLVKISGCRRCLNYNGEQGQHAARLTPTPAM